MIKAGPWDYLGICQAGAALSLVPLGPKDHLRPKVHSPYRYEGTIVPKSTPHSSCIGPALDRPDPYQDTHTPTHSHTHIHTLANPILSESECRHNDPNQQSPAVPYNQTRPEVGRKREGRDGKGREERLRVDDYNTPIPIFGVAARCCFS